MDQGLAIFLAALITAVGGILAALFASLKKENRKDHGVVLDQLRFINQNVERTSWRVAKVDVKLDHHISNHEREQRLGNIAGINQEGNSKAKED